MSRISFKKFVNQRGMILNDNHQKMVDAIGGCRVTLLNGRYRAIGITTTILNYLAWEAEFSTIPIKMLYLDSHPPSQGILSRMGYRNDTSIDHYRVGKSGSLDTGTFNRIQSKFRGYSQPYDVVVAEDIKIKEFINLFDLIAHTTRPERTEYIHMQGLSVCPSSPDIYTAQPIRTFYREPPRIIVSSYDYEAIEEFLISWYNNLNKDEDDQSLALVHSFNDRLSFINDPNYRPY